MSQAGLAPRPKERLAQAAARPHTRGLSMLGRLLMLLIRLYQLTLSRVIVAIFGPVCRFEPSCSSYAFECIRLHGALRGSLLSLKRLSKCHPFHPGGYDPPPPRLCPPATRPDPSTLDAKG